MPEWDIMDFHASPFVVSIVEKWRAVDASKYK